MHTNWNKKKSHFRAASALDILSDAFVHITVISVYVRSYVCGCALHTYPGGHAKLSVSSNHPFFFFFFPYRLYPSLHSLSLSFFTLHFIPSSIKKRPLRLYCSLFLGNTHTHTHTHTCTHTVWRDGRHIVRGGVFKQKHLNGFSLHPLNGRMGVS